MKTTQYLLDKLKDLEANPSTFHFTHLKLLEEISKGEHAIIDANNPLVFLMQVLAVNTTNAINASYANIQNQYPKLAKTEEQLYHHMSDNDYINRFAQPCRNVKFVTFLNIKELESNMVDTVINGKPVKQLIIPRDTVYRVKGVDFYQHENILIRKTEDGSFQTSYEYSNSPKLKADLPPVENRIRRYGNKDYLVIFFKMDQLRLELYDYPITKSIVFNETISLEHKYQHCRILQQNNNGEWKDIKTTHSDLVYDPNVLTAVLKVTDSVLTIKIPEIYQTKNLLGDSLKVLVYTTHGKIDMKLDKLPIGSVNVAYKTLIKDDLTKYTAPVGKMTDFFVISEESAVGGREAISFEQLRENVIYSPHEKDVPINEDELLKRLKDSDFKPTKLHSTVLGQDYLASNYLEGDLDNNIPAIGVAKANVILDSVKPNYSKSYIVHTSVSSTLTPKAIFKQVKGGYELLQDDALDVLESKQGDELVKELNKVNYFYNPFFIMVDESNAIVTHRVYYLDNPRTKLSSFNATNVELGINIATDSIKVTRHDDKFVLDITATIPKGLIDVDLQLKFKPVGTEFISWLLPIESTMEEAKKKAHFKFEIHTKYDINSSHLMDVSNFLDGRGNEVHNFLGLETNIDLVYLTSTNTQFISGFDSEVNTDIIKPKQPNTYRTAVTHESTILDIGEYLSNYSVEGESVIIPKTYKTHSTSKLKTYKESKLKVQDTGFEFKQKADGTLEFEFEYRAGDTVKDSEGKDVYEYKEGDIIKDVHGHPIEDTPPRRETILKLPLYDANFKFATTFYVKRYVDKFPKDIAYTTNPQIRKLASELLERATLVYAPVNTATVGLGQTNSGLLVDFNTALSIVINITASPKGLNDDALKRQTEKSITDKVKTLLKSKELSLINFYKEISKDLNEEIINIDIEDFLPEGGYVKLQNGLNSFSIKSIVKFKNNGEIDVEDDIRFNWIKLKK